MLLARLRKLSQQNKRKFHTRLYHLCVIAAIQQPRDDEEAKLDSSWRHHRPYHRSSCWGAGRRWRRRHPWRKWGAGRTRWGLGARLKRLQTIFSLPEVKIGVFCSWNSFSAFFALQTSHGGPTSIWNVVFFDAEIVKCLPTLMLNYF